VPCPSIARLHGAVFGLPEATASQSHTWQSR
jgi:hypothetical protein